MENPRADKVAVVAEVGERLDAAEAAVLTEYRGLDVGALAELRRALTEAGGTYKIYKNTLVRLAAQERGLDIDDLLTGPTAIAFVDGDAAGVAKALRDFAKGNPALVIKGGLLGRDLLSTDQVSALAELPSRDQLLAQIVGLFAAPLRDMASLLDAVPRSFTYALGALVEAGGAPGAPEAAPEPAEAAAPAAAPEADDTTEAPAADDTTEAPAADDTTEAPAADDTTSPADAGDDTPAESAATEES